MQQVVDFSSTAIVRGDAKIARMANYEPVLSLQNANTTAGILSRDDMLTAALSPLFPSSLMSSTEVGVDCYSGNCTLDPFDSLSVCSERKDTSTYLQWACLPTYRDWAIAGSKKSNTSIKACGIFTNSE